MASSTIGHVRHVMTHIIMSQPASVLDIGVGFGRWGFLCREMLDAFAGRVDRSRWRIRIEGIEIYEKYLQNHQRYIYDKIHVGNAKDVIKTLGRYDIIIIGDMLEHLAKDDAWGLFHAAMERADKALVLNLPIGEGWLREIGSDNKYEDHLSWWTLDEFADYRPDIYMTRLMNGQEHASMFITAANYGYITMINEGEKAEAEGAIQRAADIYSGALRTKPDRPEAYMALANILLDGGRTDEAAVMLENMTAACPDYIEGRFALASLQKATGKKTAAMENLKYIIEKNEGSEKVREAAESMLKELA